MRLMNVGPYLGTSKSIPLEPQKRIDPAKCRSRHIESQLKSLAWRTANREAPGSPKNAMRGSQLRPCPRRERSGSLLVASIRTLKGHTTCELKLMTSAN